MMLAIIVIYGNSFAKITSEKTTVYFNTTEHQLDEKAKSQLDKLIQKSLVHPDFKILIEGHTDNEGTIGYNNELSLNRSESVKAYLLENGIKEKLIEISYKGELAPIFPNNNSKNMGSNRRVEITYTSYRFDDIAELERELSPSTHQTIIIDPNKVNLIEGEQGVLALIPENTFRSTNGELLTEKVTVELTEALSFTDFISSGLETKSEGQVLETGGMLNISAKTTSGKEITIGDGEEIILAVPNQDRKDDMEVFVSESGEDWSTTGQEITNKAKAKALRPFPVMKTQKSKFPVFKYQIDQPNPPKAPKRVYEPHKPKEQSYKRPIPWYKLNKKKIRERQENHYQASLNRYNKRMERYERLDVAYDKKMKAYEKTYEDYEIAVEVWEENKKIAFAEFKSTPPYVEAKKRQAALYNYHLKNYKLEVQLWRAERKKAAVKWGENMDLMGITSDKAMDNYVFAINKLSWINVDRFYKMTAEEKQMIVMSTEDAENEKVLILFKDIKSMLSCKANIEENAFTLDNFPKKEDAYIFAYKVVSQRPMVCFMAMNGSDNYQLQYIESTFSEIKEILGQFGSS